MDVFYLAELFLANILGLVLIGNEPSVLDAIEFIGSGDDVLLVDLVGPTAQVAGNFNTMLMLRVKALDTAAMLTDQLPRVEVFTLMSVSGVDDSSDPGSGVDFKSRNEDRISVSEVPMLTAADMVTLPKRQAFALLEGGLLWKIHIPLPNNSEDTAMPSDFEEMAAAMHRSYITNDHWYRVTDHWWHAVSEETENPTESEDPSEDG